MPLSWSQAVTIPTLCEQRSQSVGISSRRWCWHFCGRWRCCNKRWDHHHEAAETAMVVMFSVFRLKTIKYDIKKHQKSLRLATAAKTWWWSQRAVHALHVPQKCQLHRRSLYNVCTNEDERSGATQLIHSSRTCSYHIPLLGPVTLGAATLVSRLSYRTINSRQTIHLAFSVGPKDENEGCAFQHVSDMQRNGCSATLRWGPWARKFPPSPRSTDRNCFKYYRHPSSPSCSSPFFESPMHSIHAYELAPTRLLHFKKARGSFKGKKCDFLLLCTGSRGSRITSCSRLSRILCFLKFFLNWYSYNKCVCLESATISCYSLGSVIPPEPLSGGGDHLFSSYSPPLCINRRCVRSTMLQPQMHNRGFSALSFVGITPGKAAILDSIPSLPSPVKMFVHTSLAIQHNQLISDTMKTLREPSGTRISMWVVSLTYLPGIVGIGSAPYPRITSWPRKSCP